MLFALGQNREREREREKEKEKQSHCGAVRIMSSGSAVESVLSIGRQSARVHRGTSIVVWNPFTDEP